MSDLTTRGVFSSLDHYGRRRIVQVLLTLMIATGLYFLTAGSLHAVWGWVYLFVAVVMLIYGALYVLKSNPQAINERGRPPEGQKKWDKVLILIYSVVAISTHILAGLDIRFGWSSVPIWVHLIAVVVTIFSSALTYGAMANNRFLSMYVQVITERGHQVVTSGPYRFVRHPMYLALVVSWPALALLFGSYLALIPGLLASALIILRTALEDRTLQIELPGYSDYARQVRYRLLPGVW